jgi:LPS-assembly lipoprotein
MSLPELTLPRFWRGCAAALCCLALAGCIQPLYGSFSEGGPKVAEELRAISVDPIVDRLGIADRLGHYVENELIFGLNGTGSSIAPKYHLTVTLRENVQTPLIDTVSGIASAATVVVRAEYKLVPIGSTEPLAKGTVNMASSYDRTSQRFANLRAARDAEIRDATRLADLIKTELAATFAAAS